MQTPLSIEELVINDSFINYCYQRNRRDIQQWENYLLIFPDQAGNMEEAKSIVLGISGMYSEQQQQSALSELQSAVASKYNNEKPFVEEESMPTRSFQFGKIWKYAAAAVVVGAGLFVWLNKPAPTQNIAPVVAAVTTKEAAPLVYETNYGEKKTITLPDGSKVVLNAKSILKTDKDFGVTGRNVYLTGEAFFDVTHNAQMPFIVNMNKFEVKVLGTMFNVKAYAEDRIQEASLIRGKVQVIMKKENKSIFLSPNEKAVIQNDEVTRRGIHEEMNKVQLDEAPKVTAVTYNSKDSSIRETSWVYDRLDIYDKPFSQIRTDLERLYNVDIEFKDKKVANYRFSATFEKETIEQVLKALQLSYPFHYSIKENEITISK
ncbi:MAG: FecR family protein [Agriterribacter sp.]